MPTYLALFPKEPAQKHLIIKGGDVIAGVIWQATFQQLHYQFLQQSSLGTPVGQQSLFQILQLCGNNALEELNVLVTKSLQSEGESKSMRKPMDNKSKAEA